MFNRPFLELVFQAAQVHREHFDPCAVQLSTLLSVKTGGCTEDCEYCPQSAHYHTGVEKTGLMAVDEVVALAKIAKKRGASRFCMGAAWRSPKPEDIPQLADMVRAVKEIGLETCGTFGLLDDGTKRGWITTTTISTPTPAATTTSSTPAATKTAWTRWAKCAKQG